MTREAVKPVEALIWDLDGTLLDSIGVLEEGLGEVLPAYGRQLPPHDVVAQHFHGSLEDSIRGALGGVPDDELGAIVKDFLRVQDKSYELIDHHLFDDAVMLAQRAHDANIRQVLVTNRAHQGRLRASPRSIVERSVLHGYFEGVVCGDDSAFRKPDCRVLDVLKDRLAINPETTLVIGDQHVDAELARNLGAPAVIVSRQGEQPSHMERLGSAWQEYVTIVASLESVVLQRS